MFQYLSETVPPVHPRDEFYVCNALIQLIENVYADLDLEHTWEHPHVRGWMKVFERWAEQPAFRRTWKISEGTYAERFRNFYNDRLRGRPLALPRSFIASHRGRGAAGGWKENTIDAFLRVIKDGASVIELDVRKLASGHLVLLHDDRVGGIPVAQMTLTDLQNHGSHVVTLEACAKELYGLVQLDVELKVPGIEADVLDVLRGGDEKWRRRDFVLTSFHESMIASARAIDPKVRTGLLIDDRDAFDTALENFLDIRTDFLAPEENCLINDGRAGAPQQRILREKGVLDRAAEQRVPLVPWPVNDRKRLELFLRHESVAGVITDDVRAAIDVKKRL